MGAEGLGGGVIIALAAVLWLVYLMPTWFRRRQYLATERNAVRLQQTLRILAETAEVPGEVRAETTARSVVEQHRALRVEAQRAEAVARARDAAAARALARLDVPAPREPRQKAAAVSALAGARLRRGRIAATAVLVASGIGVAVGLPALLTGGAWLVLVVSSLGVFGSLGVLQRIATVAAARRASVAVDRTVSVAPPVQSFTDWQRTEPERPTWTPVPLPKPMYLARSEQRTSVDVAAVSAAENSAALQQSLLKAAAKAEEALRAAQAGPEVASLPAASGNPAASGYAAMGLVGEPRPAITDLDAVLRRRRAS